MKTKQTPSKYVVGPKWPLDPLYKAAALRGDDESGGIENLSKVLGVNRRTITRWAMSGIPDKAADHAAIKLGRHPVNIWPDWFIRSKQDDT